MPTLQQFLKGATFKKPRSKLGKIVGIGLIAATSILAYVVGSDDITISGVIQAVVSVLPSW